MEHSKLLYALAVLAVAQLGASYYMYDKITTLNTANIETSNILTGLQTDVTNNTETTEQRIIELSDSIYAGQQDVEDIQDALKKYDRSFDKLTDSVDDLEKLSTTDPELLQKYSKVYFLNEHYAPADLTALDDKYIYDNGKEVSISSEVWPYLEDLLDEARDDRVDILVLSGYRSYDEQSTLKGMYTSTYGVGANTFSADQGYSEHQLGTTVDFTVTGLNGALDGFENTEAYNWLLKNAYKYGFTMSYPEGNEYYEYEPWHWRFVGKDLARYLFKNDEYFYDLEQREIDTYLIELFD